jgi:hypothetical protein
VVEGGPVTLTQVSEALDRGTPVVVIDGSGRMADVISCVAPARVGSTSVAFCVVCVAFLSLYAVHVS